MMACGDPAEKSVVSPSLIGLIANYRLPKDGILGGPNEGPPFEIQASARADSAITSPVVIWLAILSNILTKQLQNNNENAWKYTKKPR